MGLFKSKYERELENYIVRINMNMANNYKDNAQSDLRDLEARYEELKAAGVLKSKEIELFERQITGYRERLKGYSHKDQKPYWTKN